MIQLICVHEARAALHIAACCQIYKDVGTTTMTHCMDAMYVRIRPFVVTTGIKALHSPKELCVGSKQVLEWPMPVARLAEKNPACLFQNLGIDNYGFIYEGMCGKAIMENAVSDFEHAFRTNGLSPSWTERGKCSLTLALKGAV